MMNFYFAERYARIVAANLEFERAMLNLTAVIGGSVEDVTTAFKRWAMTTPLSGQVALDYCLERAIQGKSLPFTVG